MREGRRADRRHVEKYLRAVVAEQEDARLLRRRRASPPRPGPRRGRRRCRCRRRRSVPRRGVDETADGRGEGAVAVVEGGGEVVGREVAVRPEQHVEVAVAVEVAQPHVAGPDGQGVLAGGGEGAVAVVAVDAVARLGRAGQAGVGVDQVEVAVGVDVGRVHPPGQVAGAVAGAGR